MCLTESCLTGSLTLGTLKFGLGRMNGFVAAHGMTIRRNGLVYSFAINYVLIYRDVFIFKLS